MDTRSLPASCSGGKVHRPSTGDPPSTPHQAYVAGLDAAQRGDDLVIVVHTALRSWPMDEGLGELAELITCASLGYWTEGGGR